MPRRTDLIDAAVEVSPGARYVEWDATHLRTLLTRSPDLRIAFESMLNRDLAGKLGKAYTAGFAERRARPYL